MIKAENKYAFGRATSFGFLVFIFITYLSVGAAGVNFFYMKKNEKASFDIDATQEMSTSTLNRVLYGNALGIRWKGEGENFGEKIKNFFSKLLLVITRTINVLFITNPVFFWLWVLLRPEKMGDFLSEGRFWRTRVGAFMKKLSIRTAETILPTGRLFTFMEALTPSGCSVENQIKFFNFCRLNGNNWELNWFSKPAQKRIWGEFYRYPGVAEKFITEGYTLSDDELCGLIEYGHLDLVAKYSDFKTLSLKVMKALYVARAAGAKELFFSSIAQHGAQAYTPEMVCGPDRPLLREAMREHSQLAIVRREQRRRDGSNTVFFNLAKSEDLFLRTEKELNLEQYQALHSLCKHLSKEAILFKANPQTNQDWLAWANKFLKWEDLRFPEWELLVLRTPELRELVLRGGLRED